MADLAQCARCQTFTLLDKTGPVAVAVDLKPLDIQSYRDALMGQIGLLWVEKAADGTSKRLRAHKTGSRPVWDENGAQIGPQPLHAEHGCPASSQRVVKTIDPKGSAPVTPGAPPAGSRPLAAHVYAERGPATRSPAASATSRLSSAYPVCGTCGRNIKAGQIFTGVQHGNSWQWAEHEGKCP